MNIKSIFIKSIAISAIVATATACKPDVVEDDAMMAAAVSLAITGMAKGNCAISVNGTGLYYGGLVQATVENKIIAAGPTYISSVAGTGFLDHYNSVTSQNLAAAGLTTEPYVKKYDAFFTDAGTWDSKARAAYLKAAEGAIGAGLPATKGTGLMACAKIPRANCSVGALTTANQQADIESKQSIRKALLSETACTVTPTQLTAANTALFKGAPATVQAENGVATPAATLTDKVDTTDSILGEKMYPAFGALVKEGFGVLMPMKSGTTAYELTAELYTAGSNLNATTVESCESIGIEKGKAGKGLSPVPEIVYAFSEQGAAATIYAVVNGKDPSLADYTQAIACNTALRKTVNKGLPLALKNAGIQINTELLANAGNAGATESLGLCVYGGDASKRSTLLTETGLNVSPFVKDCDPTKALSAVGKFGEVGLRSFKANSANNAIDGE